MSLDERAEELASDLDADKTALSQALQNLVQYSVPLDEAVMSVRRKYGDEQGATQEPSTVDIGSLDATHNGNVNVTARVLSVGKRSIFYDGELQLIREGELGDATGKIQFTDWHGFDLSPGDSILAGNCAVTEFAGRAQLSLNETATLATRDTPVETAHTIGGDRRLDQLETGDGAVNVTVRVVEVERREVAGREADSKPIRSGVLADESCRLPFTDWEPADHAAFQAGESIRIENAHVKAFRGVPQVTLSEHSTVEPLETPVDVQEQAIRMPVEEAIASGGVFDVELTGAVLGVRDGSGLIQRCPDCARLIQSGSCRSHGDVEGYYDLRTKAILDDGTGAVTVILDEPLTADVYGGGVAAAKDHAETAMDSSVVADQLAESLVGGLYRVRGDLSVDEYGANIDAREFARLAGDPTERADSLLMEVRG